MRRVLTTIGFLVLGLSGCTLPYEMASYRPTIEPLIAEYAAAGCKEQAAHLRTVECRKIYLNMQLAYDQHHRSGSGGATGFRYVIIMN